MEMTKYLLSLPELKTKYLLSEHLCQDPLEHYFGQQQAQGGWCQNLTAQACINAAQSLRVQGSLSMLPVRGNFRKRRVMNQKKTKKLMTPPYQKEEKKSIDILHILCYLLIVLM